MADNICLSLKGLYADPRFQKLQEMFPGRKPLVLKAYLQLYRSQNNLGDEWFPDAEFKAAFGTFLHNNDRKAKIEKARKVKTESKNVLSNYKSVLAAFSHAQLHDAVDYVVGEFGEYLDIASAANPGTSRAKVLDSAGGFEAVMNEVIRDIQDETVDDVYEQIVNEMSDEPTGARKEEIRQVAEGIYQERKNILDYKDHIIARAASRIGEREGIRFEFKGMLTDWEHSGNEDTADDDEEAGKREEGESKGARYVDFRERDLASTLTPKAKRFISGIPMRQNDGSPYITIFGKERTMDYQQVALPLFRTLEGVSPENFMQALKDASGKYPWMNDIYEKLEKNPKMKPVIYTTFTRVTTRYGSVYVRGNEYKYGNLNTSAKNYSVIRHMVKNMIDGTSLGSDSSFYDGDGQIRKHLDYKKIDSDLQVIRQLFSAVEMREDKKPTNPYGKYEYQKRIGPEAMNSFIAEHNDKLAELANYARGAGLDIDTDDVIAIAKSDMLIKSRDVSLYHNRAEALAAALRSIYKMASKGKYPNADVLSNFIDKELKTVNFAMAQAVYDEVEPRTRVGKKTISAIGNTNLTHIVSDIISNKKQLAPIDYRKSLQEEFLQYEGFSLMERRMENDLEVWHETPVGWLGKLYEMPHLANNVRLAQQLQFNGVEYARMSDGQKALSGFVSWMENNHAFFQLPIAADYGSAYDFLEVPTELMVDLKTGREATPEEAKAYHSSILPIYQKDIDKYNVDAPIVKAFAEEVKLELQRMDAIEERQQDKNRVKLSKYEENGMKFSIFPEFNDNDFRRKYNELSEAKAYDFLMRSVAEQLDKIVQRDLKTFMSFNLQNNRFVKSYFVKETVQNDDGTTTSAYRLHDYYMGQFQEYSLQQYYASVQFSRIFTGGFAHFPNTTEYEKRCMFRHAPHSNLYMTGDQGILYVDDEETASAYINELTEMTDALYHKGYIDEYQRNEMISQYESVKDTDGQGLRSIESYLNLLDGLGEDSEPYRRAWDRIKSGQPAKEDINMFLFSAHKLVGAGFEKVPAAEGQLQKPIKNPVFHKYSEIVLLAPELAKYCMQARSAYMEGFHRAIQQLKKQNGQDIDLVLFSSNVKIGKHSVLAPLATKEVDGRTVRTNPTASSIQKYLVDNISRDPERYIHKVPWKYYGKAATLGTDVVDMRITMPSQSEKAIWSNIEPEDVILVRDKEMKTDKARSLYNEMKTADVIDAYREVQDIFDDKKELEKTFQEEIASKSYSADDLMYALSLLEDGRFSIPLCSPTVAKQVQEMLFSIINKRMTRPKVKGANFAQFTAVGIDNGAVPFAETSELKDSDLLGIHFEGEGDDRRITGIDAVVPMYDTRLRIFADKNGMITPERLEELKNDGTIPQEMLEFYGLRTPTDDIHSVIPLVVKAVSANVAGAGIGMSKEAMKMTGHDYDGDELHTYFRDFEIVWNNEKLSKVLYPQVRESSGLSEEAFMELFTDSSVDSGKAQKEILEKLGADKKIRLNDYKKAEVIKYDYSKSALENTKKQRDAGRKELIFSQLTSVKGSQRLIIPTNNTKTDAQAKSTAIVKAIHQRGDETLMMKLMQKARDIEAEAKQNGQSISVNLDENNLYRSLVDQPLDVINKLYEAVVGGDSPYSFSYLVDSYRRVMGGASLIDVFALFNSAHQLLQSADLYYVEHQKRTGERVLVTFFGTHRIGKLFPSKVHSDDPSDKRFATTTMNSYLQSAVDNTKNPILGLLNVSQEMGDIISFLAASGISEEQMNIILPQPVLEELVRRLGEYGSHGFVETAEDIIVDLLGDAPGINDAKHKYQSINRFSGYSEDAFINNLPYSYQQLKEGKGGSKQMAVDLLNVLIHLHPAAATLTDVVRVTRPESTSATVGPTIARTDVKLERLNDLRNRIHDTDKPCPIGGLAPLLDRIGKDANTDEELFEATKGPAQYTRALNSLMYDNVLDWFKKFFPQARQSWYDLAVGIAKRYSYRSLQEGTIQGVFADMMTWKMLKNKEFLSDVKERYTELAYDLPEQLKKMKKRIEGARRAIKSGGEPTDNVAGKLVDNKFLDLLGSQKIGGMKRIKLYTGGPVTGTMQDKIMNDWADMLLSEDEEVRQMGIDLYMYNFLTNGTRFGMYEFAHFAPITVLWSIPGLIDSFETTFGSDFEPGSEETQNFVHQYYMNHWQDDRLVPVINVEELPNGLREQFGLQSVIDDRDQKTVPLDKIIEYHYILVRTKDVGSGKPKYVTTLYNIKDTSEGVVRFERPKLGRKGAHGQMTIYYNPNISYRDIRPISREDEENASLEAAKLAGQRFGNAPSLRADLGIDSANSAPPSLREEVGLPARTTPKPSLRAELGLNAPKDDRSKPMGLRELCALRERHDALSEKDAKQNEEILKNNPESIPGAFAETSPYVDDGSDTIDNFSVDPNAERRSQYAQRDDDSYAVYDTIDDQQSNQEDPRLNNSLDDNVGGYDEYGTLAEEPGNQMPHLVIAQRDGAEVKNRNVPVTPGNIREARKQKAFVELNKRLRQILRDNGIAVGCITNVEARMSMAGVTDFDTAKVTAEGLKELIRIANGYAGERALPEEFAHMALEMLGHDHPLVTRLLNSLENNDEGLREAFGNSYDAYLDYYKNDMNLMRLEAAGKLVAKHLLMQQEVQSSGLRRLVSRIVDAVKTLLRKLGLRQVNDAILDSEGIASQLARDLLGGRLADELSLDNVNISGQMADIEKDITEANDILSKMLKIELKRLQVLKKRLAYRKDDSPHESVTATEQQIARLEAAIKSKKTESAIYTYISNAIDFLAASKKSLEDTIAGGYSVNSVCKKLRITQDVIYSYKVALKNIKDAIDAKELEDNDMLRNTRDKFNGILNEMLDETDRYSLQYFQGTLRDFYGEDGLTITAGKERGRHISIEEMSTHGDRDVSIISRWVHSMGDCNDLVLKMIDGIVKKAKFTARRDTERIQSEINVAFNDLVKKTGSRDQSFMFARNPETGARTGEYITAEAAERLSDPQREYYHRIIRLKNEVDKLLPESKVAPLKIVMLRKTALDKAREANNLKDKGKYLWQSIRNTVMDTSESIDYDHYEVETDFEKNRVDKLPILYTNKGKKETFDDMTEDVATSVLAYAGMANEYYQLNNIIGEIENARYMSSRRQIVQKAGSKFQRETVQDDDGLGFHQDFTVPQARTNIQQVLEDFLQMHVYGHLRRNEGTFGRTKISKRKTVDTLNALTSYSQLAINLPQRIANVTVGGANILIQAADKGMYSMKDVLYATKVYMQHTPNRLLDTGSLDSNDKLSLFIEYFDVTQDNGRKYKNAKYRKGKIGRVVNTNLLYSGLMIGEDYLASTTALALANNFKVKNTKTNKTENLWDAYEVKYRDPANKTGAYLALKDGYVKMNGMPITAEDEQKFMNKVAATNFELQGIYNQDDKSAIQSTALGALVMMYRKWIAPALKRRYGDVHYDHLKEQYEEGYWRTTGRYVADSIQNIIREGEGLISSWTINYDKMTDYEKSNIAKALRESGIIAGVVFSIALLEKLPPDDDENKTLAWFDQMLLYQLYRLRNEIGSQAPTPLFVKETLRLLESPFAAVEPLKNMLELYKLALPSSYITEVKNGPYKGHTKAYKYIWDLPPLCLAKHWQRFKDPSSMINFYRNDMK